MKTNYIRQRKGEIITYHHFTAIEVAEAIQELGFRAKVYDDDDRPRIESASSGIKWNAQLRGIDPFYNSVHVHTAIWVNENPLEWANKWNSLHLASMAHVIMQDDVSTLTADEDGDYMIIINFTYDFEGGVSHQYLEHAFSQWLREIESLSDFEDIKKCAARSSESSGG